MKSYCMFRESVNAPIFESSYIFETGEILRVPVEKFLYKLPEEFSTRFDTPSGYGIPASKDYYVLALQLTGGLVALNFYDVGITVITKSKIFVFFFADKSIKEYQDIDSSANVFKYDKTVIGIYKTVVRQLGVSQRKCSLIVDNAGDFVTNTGVVNTGVVYKPTVDELKLVGSGVSQWLKGYDGVLINNDGVPVTFKVNNNKIEYYL